MWRKAEGHADRLGKAFPPQLQANGLEGAPLACRLAFLLSANGRGPDLALGGATDRERDDIQPARSHSRCLLQGWMLREIGLTPLSLWFRV